MRIKEWFGYHFPELAKIVSDNEIYVKVVDLVGCKENISDDIKEELAEITLDEDVAQ